MAGCGTGRSSASGASSIVSGWSPPGPACDGHASSGSAAPTRTRSSSTLRRPTDGRWPPILEAWLKPRARAAIERDIARHAAALGVSPAAISIRDQRTRWGSASHQGRLAFSWRLILAPPEALETVVVHELAHLRVFGHGPRFWGLVATRRPDHKVWRRWLREHSAELHGALDERAER